MSQAKALRMIINERARQVKKWGRQHRDPCEWLSILTEEVGEAAAEANALTFAGEYPEHFEPDTDAFVSELVQVAAVAVQALEDLLH